MAGSDPHSDSLLHSVCNLITSMPAVSSQLIHCNMVSPVFLCMALPHGLTNLPLTTSLQLWTCYFLIVPGILAIQIGICRWATLTFKRPSVRKERKTHAVKHDDNTYPTLLVLQGAAKRYICAWGMPVHLYIWPHPLQCRLRVQVVPGGAARAAVLPFAATGFP